MTFLADPISAQSWLRCRAALSGSSSTSSDPTGCDDDRGDRATRRVEADGNPASRALRDAGLPKAVCKSPKGPEAIGERS